MNIFKFQFLPPNTFTIILKKFGAHHEMATGLLLVFYPLSSLSTLCDLSRHWRCKGKGTISDCCYTFMLQSRTDIGVVLHGRQSRTDIGVMLHICVTRPSVKDRYRIVVTHYITDVDVTQPAVSNVMIRQTKVSWSCKPPQPSHK